MKCPDCGEPTVIKRTNYNRDNSRLNRDRECKSCAFRGASREMWLMDVHVLVQAVVDMETRLEVMRGRLIDAKHWVKLVIKNRGAPRNRSIKLLKQWVGMDQT